MAAGVVGWGKGDWGVVGMMVVMVSVSKLGGGGRGAGRVGWVQARKCVELTVGTINVDAFVLEFVCVYRSPLF